jgi:hypothetical protein
VNDDMQSSEEGERRFLLAAAICHYENALNGIARRR